MKRNFNIYTVAFVDNHGQLRLIEYTVNEDFIVQKEVKIINNVTGNYVNVPDAALLEYCEERETQHCVD